LNLRKKLIELDPYGAENIYSLAKEYLIVGDKASAIKMRDAIVSMAPGTDVAKRAESLLVR
jgi:hypothetical protein